MDMTISLRFWIQCGLLVCCCGHIVGSYDLDNRIVTLESLALKVNALTIENEDELHTLEKQVPEKLSHHLRQHTLTGRQASNISVVAFDVHVNSTSMHISGGHAVKFNQVNVNKGGGYDVGRGKFTCPIHGLYQFATTIPSSSKSTIDCELVMDSQQLGHLHGNSPGFDQATQVVVVECAVGQQVWVRHLRHSHDSGQVSTKYNWARFSGHLVTTL